MPEHNAEVKHPLTSTRTSNHPEEDDIAEIQSTEAAEAAENNWTTVDEQLVHVDIHGLYRDDVLKSFPAPKIFRQTATVDGTTTEADNNIITGEDIADADLSLFQLTGLETQEPILQIGRQVFAGTYSDSADTSVFFHCTDTAQEEAEAGEQDEVFSRILSRLSAKLKWKTKKKLTFKRVFLKPIEK